MLALGCSTEPCVHPPCPSFEAVEITVTSQGGGALSGLNVTSMGSPTGFCDAGSTCHVFGGPGDYALRVSATGFAAQDVNVTVPGEAGGCNSCGRVDTQRVSVVLSPANSG